MPDLVDVVVRNDIVVNACQGLCTLCRADGLDTACIDQLSMVEILRRSILLCNSPVSLMLCCWDVFIVLESRRLLADGVAISYCTLESEQLRRERNAPGIYYPGA
jgi:hypothetical protein